MRAVTKRILALVLTLAMILSLGLTVQAVGSPVSIELNGTAMELTAPAYIDGQNRTQVPVTIGPQLGLTYQQKEGEVTFVKGEASLTFRDGEKQAGGMTMDTAADLSGSVGYVPLVYLARFFGIQVAWDGVSRTVSLTGSAGLTVADISCIQAYTDMTFYGQGLGSVEITYRPGVDVSGVTAQSYSLEDRGTLSPDFGRIEIAGVSVQGQTVTLSIAENTGATSNNKMIYTGDQKEGSRERNAFGIYCTGAWYRDVNGVIYYGKEDTAEYRANTTGMGYQARPCLELRLRHTGEAESASACLANEKGQYNAGGLWKQTIDANFGEGGFQTFEELGIQVESTAKNAKDVVPDQYVRGYLYVPEDYTGDEEVPLVVTISGNGTSFWILEDGTNNFGTNIMYDAATTSWIGKGAIVVGIHDRSIMGGNGEDYDYLLDDVNVIKYLLEHYNIDRDRIIIHGNSRSTMAASTIIQALAGQPYSAGQDAADWGDRPRTKTLDKSVYDFEIGVFLCNNGLYGGQGLWTYEDRLAVAKTGLRAWIFDAEQDFNNIDYVEEQIKAFKEAGYSDQWIAENLRLTCFPSELFYYWGESDHSTTRINYWYFGDGEIYYGSDCHIDENGQLVYDSKVMPGGTYTVEARGASRSGTKEGHAYTVYGENFQEWALETT